LTHMAVPQGRLYIHYKKSFENDSLFQVDTPLISATAYSSARFDIRVYEEGYTEVSVIDGAVYVEGRQGNTRVDSGTMISVGADSFRLSPIRHNDEWLNWNMSRDSYSYAAVTGMSRKYLPTTLDMFCADFDQYGHWVHTPDYGYVWSPRATVRTWVPYRQGRWVWMHDDYVWVSDEPWGWAPYHYGRWAFRIDIGWFWVPPAVNDIYWSPGFVAWIYTPTYVSWVPLAPGELYYGYGDYGHHSVNIHKNKGKHINKTNVYVNSKVNHAVTVVHHDTFVKGKQRKVVDAPDNPFIAGIKVSPGRPSVKQVQNSTNPPKVGPQQDEVLRRMAEMRKTKGEAVRQSAAKENSAVFESAGQTSSPRVNKDKQSKQSIANQISQNKAQNVNNPSGNATQQAGPKTVPPTAGAIHRAGSGNIPQVNTQSQQQYTRTPDKSGGSVQQSGPKTTPPTAGATHRTEPGVTPSSDNPYRQGNKQVPTPYENNSQYGPQKILAGK